MKLHQIRQLEMTELSLVKCSITSGKIVLWRVFTCALITAMSFACFGLAAAQEKAEKITFDDHIKPILKSRCSSCHNPQRREGDVDVTNYTNLMLGGGSGEVIASQDSSGSYLYQLITHEQSPEMPPSGTKIPAAEIQKIAKWIDLGALENMGSKAAAPKPKLDMAMSENPTKRPDVLPMPLRMPLQPVIKPKRPSVLAIATSPWAPLAAISTPKQVLLYNTQTMQLAGVLPIQEGVAHSLRFSRNGQLLLAGGGRDGANGKTILFNVITGDRVTTVGEELDVVLASDISSNHELIAIGGPNKLVKVHATASGELQFEINKHTEWVTALEFSPDGEYLATGDRNGGLYVWESDSGNEVFTLKGHTKAITAISWRADSRILASTSEDGTIRTWELKDGKQLKSWNGHGGGTTSLEFLRDGNLVSCGRDKVAKLFDQNGKMLKQFNGLSDVAVAVSYCDESNRVLASDWTGRLAVWNAGDAKHIGDLSPNPPWLSVRLANAEYEFEKAKQKHAPLAQQAEATKSQTQDIQKSLQQAKQTQASVQTKLTQTEQQFAAAKKQFDSTQAQHIEWRKERDAKVAAKPLVKDSYDKAIAAANSLPNDSELKQAAASLDAKFKQLRDRVNELTGLIDKSHQEKKTTKAQMDGLSVMILAGKDEQTEAVAQVASLQKQLGQMNEKLKVSTAAASEAKGQLDSAAQLVDRCKSDIAFIVDLKALRAELSQKQKLIDDKQLVVDQAKQELTKAEEVVRQANKQKADIKKQVDEVKQRMMKLRGAK